MVASLLLAPAAPSGLDVLVEKPPRRSKTALVMLYLLDRAVGRTNAVSGRVVRTATKMKPDDVHRVLSSQAAGGRVNKAFDESAGPRGEFKYWLEPDQAAEAKMYRLLSGGRLPYRHEGVSAADIATRLKFLLYCKESTYLGEHKILDSIIADYRAALKQISQTDT